MLTQYANLEKPAKESSHKPPLIPDPLQPDPATPDTPAPISVHRLDFVKLGLPEYRHKFALVIDNLFTSQDCARYLEDAQSTGDWEAAALSGGQPGNQYMNTSYRKSGRIIVDTPTLAKEILDRLRPYLKDIEYLEKSPLHTQYSEDIKYSYDPPARLSKLNERLRFLKYTPGQYFRKHCDGTYYTPDRKFVSYYTLQLYLNGSSNELEGGATRFWKMGRLNGQDSLKGNTLRQFVDVEPRTGRVLVFEQHGLFHSGEDVKHGTKLNIRTDMMYEVCPGAEHVTSEDEIIFE